MLMQSQSEKLVRKQFFISPAQVKKLEKLSSSLKGRSAAQIVRDAIDAYDSAGELTQIQQQDELLAIAHEKVKEAIIRTEDTIKKS